MMFWNSTIPNPSISVPSPFHQSVSSLFLLTGSLFSNANDHRDPTTTAPPHPIAQIATSNHRPNRHRHHHRRSATAKINDNPTSFLDVLRRVPRHPTGHSKEPNHEDLLNPDAAAVLRDNPKMFESNVRRAMTDGYVG